MPAQARLRAGKWDGRDRFIMRPCGLDVEREKMRQSLDGKPRTCLPHGGYRRSSDPGACSVSEDVEGLDTETEEAKVADLCKEGIKPLQECQVFLLHELREFEHLRLGNVIDLDPRSGVAGGSVLAFGAMWVWMYSWIAWMKLPYPAEACACGVGKDRRRVATSTRPIFELFRVMEIVPRTGSGWTLNHCAPVAIV